MPMYSKTAPRCVTALSMTLHARCASGHFRVSRSLGSAIQLQVRASTGPHARPQQLKGGTLHGGRVQRAAYEDIRGFSISRIAASSQAEPQTPTPSPPKEKEARTLALQNSNNMRTTVCFHL